ncbi:DUF4268 domain-containing protein [Fodinibius halophilus]|uniref:DUF4268 domain-containing protein n=1 Tax=Fodinibius halophilus TaxID=1736908 RepID=A0A6M1T979_9BACT|nr:DUF4268 domain-containing protein [Fodinibius halophilus]NGP90025.1 DUF4268 domain-containing protein [Fodinibius halophilus]
MSTFGNLQQVDLRKGWEHEALNFTKWLVKPENLKMLSDEIGIELAPIKSEARTGRYSVDILAEEQDTGQKVIVENQLEQTDHDHLGKLVTYASGHDAKYVVWIVRQANEEHRQAMEWLNDYTNNQINFFLIRLELWQIDESKPAVKMNTIVMPNEWTKTLREQNQTKELTDTKLLQFEFWKQFVQYCNEKNSTLRLGRKVRPKQWYNISIGRSNARISLTLNTYKQEIRCTLYIPDDQEYYKNYYERKEEVEKELDEKLVWLPLPDKKACRIRVVRTGNIEHEDRWDEYFQWLKEKAEKFHEFFGA